MPIERLLTPKMVALTSPSSVAARSDARRPIMTGVTSLMLPESGIPYVFLDGNNSRHGHDPFLTAR